MMVQRWELMCRLSVDVYPRVLRAGAAIKVI